MDLIVYDSDAPSSTAIATIEPRNSEDEREANARLIETSPATPLGMPDPARKLAHAPDRPVGWRAEGIRAAIESLETVIARATGTDANPNES